MFYKNGAAELFHTYSCYARSRIFGLTAISICCRRAATNMRYPSRLHGFGIMTEMGTTSSADKGEKLVAVMCSESGAQLQVKNGKETYP